jgi:hypothetical protein
MSWGELWDVLSLGRARRRRRLRRLVRHRPRSSRWGTAVAVVVLTLLVGPRAVGHVVAAVEGPRGSTGPYTGTYRFMQFQPGRPGTPVTWSPCRPIHVLVNDNLAPPSGQQLLVQALDRVHRASGLTFVLDGHSDALPTFAGKTWNRVDRPPVLVGWTTPGADPRLAGDVAGVGGSSAAGSGTQKFYVTGEIALDTPALEQLLARPGGVDAVRGVIVHELGHVVGLAHVDDDRELMSPHGRRDGRLGIGDRSGLTRLGEGPCLG